MSFLGLLDSTIGLYRVAQEVIDDMGDVERTPAFVVDFRGALGMVGRAGQHSARDEGAGNVSTGAMVLYSKIALDIRLSDMIYVKSGPMKGTWWILAEPAMVTRGVQRETPVRPYVGDKPTV